MNANYRRLPHFVAMLAFAIVASAAAIRADGNLKLTGTSTMTNPCNGELVTGVVEVVLGVHANANGHVKVHRSFHGTLEGDEGNSYQVSSIANKLFDNTFPFFYVIEGTNHVTGLGDGPDFDVETRIRVDVDEDQQPVGYAAMVTSATCKAG